MAYTVYWDDEAHTIVRWDQHGEVTVEHFREAEKQTHAMAATIEGSFDMLVDGTGAKVARFPISELQRAFREASPKQNLTVFVTDDAFARALVNIVKYTRLPITRRIFFVRTVEEARKLIADRRATR
jgi:hypothetical protein